MADLLETRNDFVFKRIFADEPELLVALINAVRFRAPPIAGLKARNPAIDPAALQGKYVILAFRDARRRQPRRAARRSAQLDRVELRKADRLRQRPPALSPRVTRLRRKPSVSGRCGLIQMWKIHKIHQRRRPASLIRSGLPRDLGAVVIKKADNSE
jgi:hypothetical protein